MQLAFSVMQLQALKAINQGIRTTLNNITSHSAFETVSGGKLGTLCCWYIVDQSIDCKVDLPYTSLCIKLKVYNRDVVIINTMAKMDFYTDIFSQLEI